MGTDLKVQGFMGWANMETWSIQQHILNDRVDYNALIRFLKKYKGRTLYKDFVAYHLQKRHGAVNQAGFSWFDKKLNIKELNDKLREVRDDMRKQESLAKLKETLDKAQA